LKIHKVLTDDGYIRCGFVESSCIKALMTAYESKLTKTMNAVDTLARLGQRGNWEETLLEFSFTFVSYLSKTALD